MTNEKATEEFDLGEEKRGKNKLILIIVAVAASLLLGGGVAAYFLVAGAGSEGEDAGEPDQEPGPVIYLALDPPFVVTLSGKPSLLQVGISVRLSSEQVAEAVRHNDPMIRHNLLNLLSSVDANALKQRAAKEALRKRLLDELNHILEKLQVPGRIDSLYFTSFVMQ